MSVLLWPLLLLLLAIAFIALEMFVPSGGALGLLAALSAIAAVIVAFFTGGPVWGTTWLAVVTVVLPISGFIAIRVWPLTPLGRRMTYRPPVADKFDNLQRSQSLLGLKGRAQTVMLPAGRILIEGQILDAVSNGMPVEAGDVIEVIQIEGNHIVVQPADEIPANKKESQEDILSQPIETLGLEELEDPLS